MQDKVLKILSSSNDFVSGQDISQRLGVSRQSVSKAVKALRAVGYTVEAVTNKGYKLIAVPAYLNEVSIKTYLNTAVIGKKLIVLDTVDSTNDYLKIKGSSGCENGLVVASRRQTKGKGRLGRIWQTAEDDCLAFSFLLRPNIPPSSVGSITPLCGLAVCKAIRAYTGIDCKIKWPNDVVVGSKKLVGILTEMSAEFDAVEYIVTGIGINVGQVKFPSEISQKATSVFLEMGEQINKNKFFAFVLEYIEDEFIKNNLELTEEALAEYTALCATIGRNIKFYRNGNEILGKAVGVDKNGELRAVTESGEICLINSGEVSVQGIY